MVHPVLLLYGTEWSSRWSMANGVLIQKEEGVASQFKQRKEVHYKQVYYLLFFRYWMLCS